MPADMSALRDELFRLRLAADEVEALRARVAELERQRAVLIDQTQRLHDERESLRSEYPRAWMLSARGVDVACERCAGLGVYMYSDSTTWSHGAGGQGSPTDVCDVCWGTGDAHRKGVDLAALRPALIAARLSAANADEMRGVIAVQEAEIARLRGEGVDASALGPVRVEHAGGVCTVVIPRTPRATGPDEKGAREYLAARLRVTADNVERGASPTRCPHVGLPCLTCRGGEMACERVPDVERGAK